MKYTVQFYHSEKLQSTKTDENCRRKIVTFYHSEKLQSTKTSTLDWVVQM